MTRTVKNKNEISSFFVVIKNLFAVLSILLLLHRASDYVSSFSSALLEAY